MPAKKPKNPEDIKVAKARMTIVYSFTYKCPYCGHGVQERSLGNKPQAGLKTCPNTKCGEQYKVEVKK